MSSLEKTIQARLRAITESARQKLDLSSPPAWTLNAPPRTTFPGLSLHGGAINQRTWYMGAPDGNESDRTAPRVPAPETLLTAVEAAESASVELACAMAADIRTCASALAGDAVSGPVERACAARWPWPSTPEGAMVGELLLELSGLYSGDGRMTADIPIEELPSLGISPADIAPIDVAGWAEPRWHRLTWSATGRWTDEKHPAGWLVETVTRGGQVPLWWFTDPKTRQHEQRCTWPALTVLFWAWSQQRRGFGTALPLCTKKPTVRTVSGLGGGAHRRKGRKLRQKNRGEVVELLMHFPDAEGTQLILPLTDTINPLQAIAREFGSVAVRDLLVFDALAWGRQGDTSGWWWLSEHLELCGLDNHAKNRHDVLARIKRLSAITLTAKFASGEPISQKLLTVNRWQGAAPDAWASGVRARNITYHPGMYTGVRTIDGEPGRCFWNVPARLLLQASPSTPVHVMARTSGAYFRANMSRLKANEQEVVEWSVGAIAADHGLPFTGATDGRGGDRVKRLADQSVAVGIWDSYQTTGPFRSADTKLLIRPGKEGLTGDQTWPARVPETGAELDDWLTAKGMSTAELAAELGNVSARTIRRAVAEGARPLAYPVRRAMRLYLWPDMSADKN